MHSSNSSTPGSNPATIQETISFLLSLNLPPVPIAPAFSAEEYPAKDKQGKIVLDREGNPKPAFTGKNPSYVDSKGVPHLLSVEPLKKRLPSKAEIKKWFDHTPGIATLGGQAGIIWIDFDAKRFESREQCETYVNTWLEDNDLFHTWIERTRSGGYHIALQVEELPTYTNFAYQGSHRGEIIRSNTPCVLAPTEGYQCLNQSQVIALPTIDDLDLVPVAATPATLPQTQGDNAAIFPDVEILHLISQNTYDLIHGDPGSDRSESLATVLKEWYGWEQWLQANEIPYQEGMEPIERLRDEWDLGDKFDRIVASVDGSGCVPAIEGEGKEAVWLRFASNYGHMLDQYCPRAILKRIKKDVSSSKDSKVVPFKRNEQDENIPKYIDFLHERAEFENANEDAFGSRGVWLMEAWRMYGATERKTIETLTQDLEDTHTIIALQHTVETEIETVTDTQIRALWQVFDPQMNSAHALARQGLCPYFGLQCFITALSVLTPKNAVHWVNKVFKNPATKHTIAYGDTSDGKDTVMALFTSLLIKLDQNATDEYNLKLERYNHIQKLMKGMKPEEVQAIKQRIEGFVSDEVRKTWLTQEQQSITAEFQGKASFWTSCPVDISIADFDIPQQKHYTFTEASAEGARNHGAMSKTPILWTASELEAVYRSMQSQSGKDLSDLLIDFWNGGYFKQLKTDSAKKENLESVISGTFQISILGAIQDDVLRSLITINDPKGKTARQDFVDVSGNNLVILEIDDEEGNNMHLGMQSYLKQLYHTLDTQRDGFEGHTIGISIEASKLWSAYSNRMKLHAKEIADQGQIAYSRWLRKLAQKAAHEAIIIHWVRYAQMNLGLITDRIDPHEQDIKSMQTAIALAEVSRIKHQAFFKKFEADQGDIREELEWLYSYLLRVKKPVTVRTLSAHRQFKGRLKNHEIRLIAEQLCKLGKATSTPQGYRAIL